MKRTLVLLLTSCAIMAGMQSCKKENGPKEAITQTINVSLKVNEEYTFSLPKNLRNDAYEIISQSKHASLSEVSVTASGDNVIRYTPQAGYTGSDQVIVSNDQEREEHGHCQGGHHSNGSNNGKQHNGGGKGEEEDHYIITFNIIVEDTASTVVK